MQTKPNTHKLSLIALTVPTWLHHWLVEFHGGSLCHTQSCTRTYNPINVCVLYVIEKRYIYEHTNTFQDSRWIEKENSNVCVLYFANLVSKSSYVMKNRVTLNRGVSFFWDIWILAITISQVLKNAITILLIGNLPLQLLIQQSMPWSTSPAKLGPLAGGVFSYRTVLPLFNWIRQSSWCPFFSLLLPHSPARHCRRRLPALATCLFSHRRLPAFAACHCRGWVATSLGHRQRLAPARRKARRCPHSWSARIATSSSCGS